MTSTRDAACVEFLQWALPRMGLRWPGFRRVRGQVCKNVARRVNELGLPDLAAYRALLEARADEWTHLDSLCRVTISRFYRDRAVWDRLATVILPGLALLARQRGDAEPRAWSIGCASGEEPYTLAMVWRRQIGAAEDAPRLRIVASEAQGYLLDRARRGVYGPSSVRDLPVELRSNFAEADGKFRIDPEVGEAVTFLQQDVRRDAPDGEFYLILCRNIVFTYLDDTVQRRVLARLARRLIPGGALVIGAHEQLPARHAALFVPGGAGGNPRAQGG